MERSAYVAMRALQGRHWWFVARRRILSDLIAGLGLPASPRILEAGCGPGGNLPMLQSHGQVSAFDMDREAVQGCEQDFGVAVAVGSLPDANPFQDAQGFDLVVALDVLEHIDRDREALRSLATTLAPGGRLLLTVPAYQWLFSSHDTLHHHKRRYSLDALRARVVEAGLVVHRASYFNTLLFPLVVLVRTAARLTGRASTADQMPAAWINRVLTAIFGAEAAWLRRARFPFGTSIFLVAGRAEAPGPGSR